MLTDYHMHLQPDGTAARADAAARWEADGGHLSRGWIGRYVERARARAVSEIAITEHVYRFAQARDWIDNPWWREEATEDVDAYCEAILAARDGGPAGAGGRRDGLAAGPRATRSPPSSTGRPFDVVLGSVHWLGALVIDHPGLPRRGTAAARGGVVARTSTSWSRPRGRGSSTCSSHPDLPKVFGHRMPPALEARLDEAVAAIAATGVAIECSSAGLRKPVGELYPAPRLLARLRAAGVPATLSSDAHAPEDVARDYPTAVAALRGAGYETITRFSRREPTQVRCGGDEGRRRASTPTASAPGRPLMLGTIHVDHPEGLVGPLGRRRRRPRALRRPARRRRPAGHRRPLPARRRRVGGGLGRPPAVRRRGAGPRERVRRVVNAHAVAICERPRLAPHRAAMEAALTGIVGAPVTVHATTTDGMGALGRGEGIACHAVALVEVRVSAATVRLHSTPDQAQGAAGRRGADGVVGIYVCGPTVYGRIHIGNARPFVVFSVLKRYLERRGMRVRLVSNLTDVNDKIYDAARAEGVPSAELARRYSDAYIADTDRLGPGPARRRAPRHRDDPGDRRADRAPWSRRGLAYPRDGDVYYRVEALPGLRARSRGAASTRWSRASPAPGKESPLDFALWKGRKPDEDTWWESPWGPGPARLAHRVLGDGRGRARPRASQVHGGGHRPGLPPPRERDRPVRGRARRAAWPTSGCTTRCSSSATRR